MSIESQELLNICEQLPEDKRAEVADFARFLLTQNKQAANAGAMERWLATAGGAARAGTTTDELMAITRGES